MDCSRSHPFVDGDDDQHAIATVTIESSADSRGEASTELVVGESMDRYRILGKLGEGGMGVVYRAHDTELVRDVALKLVLRRERDAKNAYAARLQREAQALAQLQHPNVIAVYDVGHHRDAVYIATELVEGRTLGQWHDEEARSWRDVLVVFQQAGHGLAAAHAVGLIHRDFKPDNVIVGSDGRVRVLDFGLARSLADRSDPDPVASEESESSNLLSAQLMATRTQEMERRRRWREQHGPAAGGDAGPIALLHLLHEALYGERPFRMHQARAFAENMRDGKLRLSRRIGTSPGWLRKSGPRPALDPGDRHASMTALLHELARDPTATRKKVVRWAGATALLGAAAVGVWANMLSTTAPSCPSAKPLLADAWAAPQRAALAAAFAKLDAPWAKDVQHTVETTLDRYTASWVDMHHASCEATRIRGSQSELLLDLRSTCLDRNLDELREKVAVLVSGDRATLERGIAVVQGLPALDQCADVAALTAPVPLPASPEARAKVADLRKQLARARALVDAAKFTEAAQLAASIVQQAARLQYRPLEAEALFAQSEALERQGNYREAVRAAHDASRAARAGKHDQVAAKALIALVWLVGGREHRYEEAHDLAREASAAIERLDQRTVLEAELAGNLGAVYANEGRLDEALAQHEHHRAITESASGPMSPTLGSIFVDLGEVYREQGRIQEALASYERAMKIFAATWGAEHPTVAAPLNNIGLVMRRLGRLDEALTYHRRALAIFERSLGRMHPHVAEALTNLGVVLLAQGHADRAYENFRRSLAIDTEVSGAESAECAIDIINMADAQRAGHQLVDALRDGRRAVAMAEKVVGAEDPLTAEAYLSLGKTLAANRAPTDAIEQFERALAIWQRPDAELEAGAGEALVEIGAARLALGDRRAAVAVLERAIELLEKASRDPDSLVTARQLLARTRLEAEVKP